MAPSWGAGPKHRKRDPLWAVLFVIFLAVALGAGLGYIWPECQNVGSPWWCW